ncbi:hypothetical protein ABMY35_18215 [Pseudoalteromonas sp. BZB3]|uniref:hypothetical protein n=1 Tax=Pseudoalteromonas sp. BZB3 TaxID=3136670 RepID=UPI0032C3F51E
MFNYSKVALGIAACFALSGCLEVEDNNNNNNDALVQQLEQQNQILQNQLDYTKQQAEAWKTAITLVGSVELATEGDTLPSDLSVTFYHNGQWHDAVSIAADGSFEVSELPANTDFIAKVSSASNAIVKRHFFFRTPYKTDKFVQNLVAFEVGLPKTIEFTVLDEKTNLPFTDLHLEADLDADSNALSALKQVAGDNFSKATLNSETGMYELVVPKGITLFLQQDRDLDNDGTNDVTSFDARYSNQLENNQLFYLDKQKAEEFELVLNFINANGEAIKPEHVFATNNDFGSSDFTYDDTLKTHSVDANYLGSLRVYIPEFRINDTQYKSRSLTVRNYNEQTESYQVEGALNSWRDHNIAVENNVLSVVVVLEENTEQNLSLQVVTRNEEINQEQAFTYFFNSPIAINEETVVTVEKENALIATPGNASEDDSIEPGTTYFEYKNVEVESSSILSFNDTALTLKPNAKLEEGYSYRFNIEKIVNKKTDELEEINYSNTVTIENTEAFTDNAFVADNLNYRKEGELIISKNTANIAAGSNSDVRGQVCILVPSKFGVRFYNVTPKKAVVNGVETEINNSWSNSHSAQNFYKLADNENVSGSYPIRSSAQKNGTYSRTCLEMYDANYNYISSMEDNTPANENSVTVEIEYFIDANGGREYKTIEKKLYID